MSFSQRNFGTISILIFTLVIGCFALLEPTAAQNGGACYTPQGAEHKTILDVLRRPLEDNLHQQIEFVITKFRVCWSGKPNWAFVDAKPQKPGGVSINWRAAGYEDCSQTIQGLLKKSSAGAGWQVVVHDIVRPMCHGPRGRKTMVRPRSCSADVLHRSHTAILEERRRWLDEPR